MITMLSRHLFLWIQYTVCLGTLDSSNNETPLEPVPGGITRNVSIVSGGSHTGEQQPVPQQSQPVDRDNPDSEGHQAAPNPWSEGGENPNSSVLEGQEGGENDRNGEQPMESSHPGQVEEALTTQPVNPVLVRPQTAASAASNATENPFPSSTSTVRLETTSLESPHRQSATVSPTDQVVATTFVISTLLGSSSLAGPATIAPRTLPTSQNRSRTEEPWNPGTTEPGSARPSLNVPEGVATTVDPHGNESVVGNDTALSTISFSDSVSQVPAVDLNTNTDRSSIQEVENSTVVTGNQSSHSLGLAESIVEKPEKAGKDANKTMPTNMPQQENSSLGTANVTALIPTQTTHGTIATATTADTSSERTTHGTATTVSANIPTTSTPLRPTVSTWMPTTYLSSRITASRNMPITSSVRTTASTNMPTTSSPRATASIDMPSTSSVRTTASADMPTTSSSLRATVSTDMPSSLSVSTVLSDMPSLARSTVSIGMPTTTTASTSMPTTFQSETSTIRTSNRSPTTRAISWITRTGVPSDTAATITYGTPTASVNMPTTFSPQTESSTVRTTHGRLTTTSSRLSTTPTIPGSVSTMFSLTVPMLSVRTTHGSPTTEERSQSTTSFQASVVSTSSANLPTINVSPDPTLTLATHGSPSTEGTSLQTSAPLRTTTASEQVSPGMIRTTQYDTVSTVSTLTQALFSSESTLTVQNNQTSAAVSESSSHNSPDVTVGSTRTKTTVPKRVSTGRTSAVPKTTVSSPTSETVSVNTETTSPITTEVTTSSSPSTTNQTENSQTSSTMAPQTTVPTVEPPIYIRLSLMMTWRAFCESQHHFLTELVEIVGMHADRFIRKEQVIFLNEEMRTECTDHQSRFPAEDILIRLYISDKAGRFSAVLTEECGQVIGEGFKRSRTFKDKVREVRLVDLRPPHVGETLPTEGPKEPGVIIAIVIASVGGVCCVALVILQVVLRRRHGRKMSTYTPGMRQYSIRSVDCHSIALNIVKPRPDSGYFNPGLDTEQPACLSYPVNFAGLANLSADVEPLYEQFQLLPNENPSVSEVPLGCEEKNRYVNVLPFSETRVRLTRLPKDETSDYINANYITGYKQVTKAYIATQAPLESTVVDFWRMVWEQQSRVIVMLTPLEEHGLSKCAEYWPDTEGVDTKRLYGDYQVELKRKEIQAEFIKSTLILKNMDNNLTRQLKHFWFTNWPQSNNPDPVTLMNFVSQIRPYAEEFSAPVVVHCSPGTGRTGTLIAIDICMQMYREKHTADILQCVSQMRRERAGVVQTREQYALIYKVLNEYATHLSSPPSSKSASTSSLHYIQSERI